MAAEPVFRGLMVTDWTKATEKECQDLLKENSLSFFFDSRNNEALLTDDEECADIACFWINSELAALRMACAAAEMWKEGEGK